jgi:hypothetical protein
MDRGATVLTLLFVAVIASGCIGGGNETDVDQYGDQAIVVHNLQVTPGEIFAGSTVRVRMSLSNVGQLPADLQLRSTELDESFDNMGRNILTNHCPDIFDVTDFSASSTNVSTKKDVFHLDPGYKVRMNWELSQEDESVPLNGYNCQLNFEVPFNYSVEAFRQIQVKDNPDVTGSEELFAKSSKGPMKLEIEAIGSSAPRGAPTFLKDDNAEVLVQLVNKEPEETSYIGTVELGPPRVEARGLNFAEVDIGDNVESAKNIAKYSDNLNPSSISEGGTYEMCPDPESIPENGNLIIYQGESKIFRCNLDWPSPAPSLKGEVYAQADYTYVKNAGTREVFVRYSGGR